MHREYEQQTWTETHPAIAARVVWARPNLYAGQLIDIVAGPNRKALTDWLFEQPADRAAGIEVAALDSFRATVHHYEAGYHACPRRASCVTALDDREAPAIGRVEIRSATNVGLRKRPRYGRAGDRPARCGTSD